MSVRDTILPVIDRARAKVASLGLRRYRVFIRRRAWSGPRATEGTATVEDIEILPTPKVTVASPYMAQKQGIAMSGGTVEDREFLIEGITPFYDNGTITGGYKPEDLDIKPRSRTEEVLVVLLGDDGIQHECTLSQKDFDGAFGYTLAARLRRRSG
jgi:hypothetical protein